MTRKGYKKHKANEPDPKFRNSSVTSFVNRMMLGGKKSVATSILYRSLDLVETRMKKPGIEVFEQALRNASPMLEVRPRRVGGATYQVPMEIRGDRRSALAMRWLIQAARSRPGQVHGRAPGERVDGRRAGHRRHHQAQGRVAQDG